MVRDFIISAMVGGLISIILARRIHAFKKVC